MIIIIMTDRQFFSLVFNEENVVCDVVFSGFSVSVCNILRTLSLLNLFKFLIEKN